MAGCAHPVLITPRVEEIDRLAERQKIVKTSVGYFISTNAFNREVTTLGGGGDSVRYYPYRDIESALQRMLATVFDKVTRLNSAIDDPNLRSGNIKIIITPELITNSGGGALSLGHRRTLLLI